MNRRSWLAWYLQERRRGRIAAQTEQASLGDDLVAHFSFEELQGTRTDDVFDYALEPQNAEVYSGVGIIGNGVQFDGSAYLMGTQQTSLFSPGPLGFSLSIWMNFEGIADPYSDAYVVNIWDDGIWPSGSSWQIWCSTPDSGDIHAQVMGSGYAYLSGAANLSEWTHICLVYQPSGSQWTLYVNGTASMSTNFGYSPAPGLLGVGGHTNFVGTPPQGVFDELAIWSRGLSATEVGTLYNNGAGLPYPY